MKYRHNLSIVGSLGDALEGRRIVLCVTGSVAAYQAPEIARLLIRYGADVIPVMTGDALRMVGEELLRWATGNDPVTNITGALEHVGLAGKETGADLILVAPATLNTITKIAAGVADTPVTLVVQTALGSGIPLLIAPAMHEPMFLNRLFLDAVEKLKSIGVEFIEPMLAEEKAKIALPEVICEHVIRKLYRIKFPQGTKALVTAGATVEYIDPIRVVTNLSSGLMGMAIARECFRCGCDTILITGRTSLPPPPHIERINILTSKELINILEQKLKHGRTKIYFGTIAVADYKPAVKHEEKIKTETAEKLMLEFTRTEKIIERVKSISPDTIVVGFKAEYGIPEEELRNRAEKLLEHADIVYASDVSKPTSIFGSPTTEGIIVTREGYFKKIEGKKKEEVAELLLELTYSMLNT
ncbi:MAG TPA: bifunctional phosphopantothenoylcysteine decarboxylase/phosphopantothenate--cysteine ligase CoaBC [Candidatus Caldiarchaeum subterraneum]|uniref:Coenzyme A biosynthesis bifunctional protein CoaBC n=1 Tax=Caldiarchaeum subterraneum TaxID=311458 RepID=A0A833EC96_CALS0|nr:bifunctional phosphopantothenoylcysteine decarboxylase/phosphopantothenate--cysteine ligase CoaBC [Candidatus Caldarchaeum subterraneum]